MTFRLIPRLAATTASLRCRLVALMLLAAVPALLLAWHAAHSERRIASLDLQHDALRAAHHVAAEQRVVVEMTRHLLTTLAAVPGLPQGEECGPLPRALTTDPAYAWMGVLDSRGRVLCGTPEPDLIEVNRAWFDQMVDSGQFSLSGFEIGGETGAKTGNAVAVAALPLAGPDGRIDRVLAAGLDLTWLGSKLASTDYPGASITVIDDAGRVLARHPENDWQGRMVGHYQIARDALMHGEGIQETQSLKGDRRAYGYTSLNGSNAKVIVGLPVTKAMNAVDATFRARLLAIAEFAILFLIVALVGARHLILQPLAILADTAHRLSLGELQARSGLRPCSDEVGVLAARFDGMAESIEALVAERTRDQTAARAEAEAANRTKTQFLAAASHDLRQPLQAMNLYLHLLTSRLHDPTQIELARQLGNSAEAARSLLDTLMGLSALETGQVRPNVQSVAVTPLLQRIADESRAEAAAKGLEIRTRPRDITVDTDPVLLERMLRNLVKNALRYTANGQILIAARPDGPGLRLEVWDTGPGIAADKLQAIFQEFYRVPGSEATDERGLGLGLATVARMGKLLGHEIGVHSRLGRGSVFFIRIPPTGSQPDDGGLEFVAPRRGRA